MIKREKVWDILWGMLLNKKEAKWNDVCCIKMFSDEKADIKRERRWDWDWEFLPEKELKDRLKEGKREREWEREREIEREMEGGDWSLLRFVWKKDD